jgi:hypothetical protein
MKRLLIGVLTMLALAPTAARAQQSDQSRRAELAARRDSLEAEVVRKFVRHLARDLELTEAQREQTERVLRESGLQRHALSRSSWQLRRRLDQAARDSTTADAEFIRLLAEYETLRTREHDLWRRDQVELSRVLDPRQRTQFLLAWARFQDDMREIISRRMRDQDGERDRRDGNRDDSGDGDGHSRDESAHDHPRPDPLPRDSSRA